MIQVLLATYNGDDFLVEQLESLLAQDLVMSVLVRDDGSSDRTQEIIRGYVNKFPEKFVFHEGEERLGAKGSFDWLLNKSTASYVAFCDQDDVWKPNKTRVLLERMRELEDKLGKDTPILVHSDLAVVNQDMALIHPSFWAFSGLDARRNGLPQLLVTNTVTGCAMLANRALVERASPIPFEATMHDHWFALVAAALGHIESVSEPLVAYRQHELNAVGAQIYSWRSQINKLITKCGRADIFELEAQAAILHQRYSQIVTPQLDEAVEGFSKLQEKSWLARRLFMLRHGIMRSGMARNLGLFLCVRLANNKKVRV